MLGQRQAGSERVLPTSGGGRRGEVMDSKDESSWSGFLAFVVLGAIGWVVYLNIDSIVCRVSNLGQAAIAQTVCQPFVWRWPEW
jgi:hypothetical protein